MEDFLNSLTSLLVAIISLVEKIVGQEWFATSLSALIILYVFQLVTHIQFADFIRILFEEAKELSERKWSVASINFFGLIAILFFGVLIIFLSKMDFVKDAVSHSIGQQKATTLIAGIKEGILALFLFAFACLSVFLVHRSRSR